MSDNNQQDNGQKSRPALNLGKEALDGSDVTADPNTGQNNQSLADEFLNSAPAAEKEPDPETKPTDKTKVPEPIRLGSIDVINKPLMECYPKVADNEREQLIADVRRHWLGRFTILFTGGILTALLVGFGLSISFLTRGIDVTLTSQIKAAISLVFVLVGIMISIGTFITFWIYNQSHMLITDQNVIELRQMGIFSRKVSHLNMINIEDVSVTKRGILPTMFNFGVLTIETAGEEENFVFLSTPKPDDYRRIVINCHERAIERIGQMGPGQRVEIAKGEL